MATAVEARPAGGIRTYADRLAFAVITVGVLLRVAAAMVHPLDFDETFTGVAARMPINRLLPFLAANDSHPPLDYVLRMPFARTSSLALWLRLPSVVLASAALVVIVRWFAKLGLAGRLAMVLAAVGSFAVTYAGDARMYAGMMLVGAMAAVAAARWLDDEAPSSLAVVSVVVLAGAFLHASGLPLAAGLFLVPGMRRDRAAWRWRTAVAAPIGVWAAAWGPSMLRQLHGNHASWIPRTTPHVVLVTLNELIDLTPGAAVIAVALVVAGLVAVARADQRTGRVIVCAAVVPTALIALVGLHAHVMLPRTMAFAWWAPLLALGQLFSVAWTRWRALGVAVAVATLALIIPSTISVFTSPEEGQTVAVRLLARDAQPGDAVAVHPFWLSPLTRWYVPSGKPIASSFGPDTDVMRVGKEMTSDRVWMLRPTAYDDPALGLEPCPGVPDVVRDGYAVECRINS